MKKHLIFIFTIIALSQVFGIESNSYKFEYITTEDGLSQSTIECFFQDSRGLMWIGTRDGLNRYDGRTFKLFRHDNRDTNTIGEGWVNTICEDHLGNMWVGTNSGVSVYDVGMDKVRRLPADKPGGSGKVSHIELGPDNKLWYGLTGDKKLISYNIEDDEFGVFNYEATTSSGSSIFDIIFTKDGRMYLATESDELLEFDREKETFKAHHYLKNVSTRNYKKSIVENENGELYIGAEQAGVHIYNPHTGDSKKIEGLNNQIVKTRVLIVSPTEVWIGTDGGGINVYNPITEDITLIQSNNVVEQSLAENTIFNMMKDRDGNIWVGHYGTGISIWKKYKEKFMTFKNNPFDPTSLPKSVVTSLFEDSRGRLWIGQDGGGLSLYNPEANNFIHYQHEEEDPTSLTTNVIICINETSDGQLILGTYAAGVMFFDPELGEVVKKIDNTSHGLTGNGVWDIYIDKQEKYWFATLGGGVDIFDPISDTLISIPDPGSTVIMKIVEAPDGMLWFASENNGISVYDPENSSHYMITTREDSPYRISGNDVKSILFSDNTAWVGTIGGGLSKIDLLTDSVTKYSTETGLSSNSIMSMLEDDSKNLWISTTSGLMKFNKETAEVVVYDKSQGTQGNEYKYNADFQLSNKFMAFGGSEGFSIFHPDSIKNSPIVPAVVFTDFKLFNESATIGEKESVLEKDINLTDRIVLNHKQKVFSFEFASLDYTAPTKNRYKYMLEGYDADTIFAGNKNYARYTNVRPGRYTFMLMASNSDGVWSEQVLQIKMRIKPPFYKTKVFIIFFLLFIAYLVNKFIRARVRKDKRDKEVLQGKIEEGKKELNERINEIEKQKTEIREREEKENELRFTNTGIVKLSEIISKDRDNIDKLSGDVISTLVDYIEASAGVLYIVNAENEDDLFLYPAAKYCHDTEEEEEVKVLSGEGYVGTAYSGKEIVYVDDMPEGKIVLSSGLGDYSIRNIVFIPIINNDECLGIFEIGSIERIANYKVDFVTKIADSLGSVLAIEKANKYTKTMLEQNMQQSEELKAQEEEMRQNMEEMLATQEEYSRQLEEAEKIQEELKEAKKTIEELRKGK